jgi:hypothetical protein
MDLVFSRLKNPLPRIDLEAEALAALEEARANAPGPKRTEALERAGILRNAVDMQGLPFAKRGRPPKPEFRTARAEDGDKTVDGLTEAGQRRRPRTSAPA